MRRCLLPMTQFFSIYHLRMNNCKLFFASLLMVCAVAFQASAQVTETPYSRIGFGTLGDNATGIQRHMGGVGYAMQGGRMVNSKNPASYAATDSLTFIWDVGIDLSQVWSKEGDTKGSAFSGGLDYLSGVFRVANNVGASFGFIPYSSVSYTFNSEIENGMETRTGLSVNSTLAVHGAPSRVCRWVPMCRICLARSTIPRRLPAAPLRYFSAPWRCATGIYTSVLNMPTTSIGKTVWWWAPRSRRKSRYTAALPPLSTMPPATPRSTPLITAI